MKRVIGLVLMCSAASFLATGAPAATPTHTTLPAIAAAHPTAKSTARQKSVVSLAPADEYFGPFKLSIIGISNTIRDTGRRYDVNHDIADRTFGSAQQIERAIRDWEKKYPKDDQLPRAVYFLQRLYTKVLTQASRNQAGITAAWMYHDFPSAPQSKQLKKVLASEHLDPLPPPTPTPVPTTLYPSVFGQTYPSEFNNPGTPKSAPNAAPAAVPPALATPPAAQASPGVAPSAAPLTTPSPPTTSPVPAPSPTRT